MVTTTTSTKRSTTMPITTPNVTTSMSTRFYNYTPQLNSGGKNTTKKIKTNRTSSLRHERSVSPRNGSGTRAENLTGRRGIRKLRSLTSCSPVRSSVLHFVSVASKGVLQFREHRDDMIRGSGPSVEEFHKTRTMERGSSDGKTATGS